MAAWFLLAAPEIASADGLAVFNDNCALCHQEGGVGVGGQFPRLAGRVGAIAANPEGRKFLPKLLLSGMSGRLSVDGQQIIGIMPSFETLSDQDIAAVLTYVSGLGHKPVVFSAAEVKLARSQPKRSSSQMAQERSRLAAKKVIP
jgi:mono/diheme cytochrome c family protein